MADCALDPAPWETRGGHAISSKALPLGRGARCAWSPRAHFGGQSRGRHENNHSHLPGEVNICYVFRSLPIDSRVTVRIALTRAINPRVREDFKITKDV